MTYTCIFPNEIIEYIIQLSSTNDLYQWILVCKTWSDTAIQLFYHTITLNERRLRKMIRKQRQHKRENKNEILFKNGNFVRKIKFQNDKEPNDGGAAKYWTKLLPFLSNLNIIDISHSSNRLFYLKDLLHFVNIKCIKNLERIITFNLKDTRFLDSELNLYYFKTCYKYRITLTHIDVLDLNQTFTLNNVYSNYVYYLPFFQNLTHLTIMGNHFLLPNLNNLLHITIYAIKGSHSTEKFKLSLLTACPNLTTFQINQLKD